MMKGLSTQTASQYLQKYGENVLTAKNAHPWYKILARQFTDVLVLILVVAAIISLFSGHASDAIVIFVIVLLNGSIGFIQEFRTEKTLEALKKMVHPEIRVLRDGKTVLIQTKHIVPEDIVLLGEGDKIPADGALIEAHSLKIEESALTGESLPIEKSKDDDVFMGTSVARGSGVFQVQKTGMTTKFGEIARLTTETTQAKSPLQKELEYIGLFVAKVTGVISLLLFFVGMWRGASMLESLLFSVSVAIAAVPEGLPTTVTVALALGASVLARKRAVIKRLSSVETLGSVTTICSDKTGTLTKNQMTVREIYLADRSLYDVSGVGYDPHVGSIRFMGGNTAKKDNITIKNKLLDICVHCNEADLLAKNNTYSVLGDPTEGALLTLAAKGGKDIHAVSDEIFPFDSERKMMSVIKNHELLVKGSPDQVLEKCTHWWDGETQHELTQNKRDHIQKHYSRMAENALRVLAFAYKPLPKDKPLPQNETEAEENLIFVGLVGMIDPPRSEVQKAVQQCHGAGIRVVVITGDYGVTATAIAQELGIVKGNAVQTITGSQANEMSDAEISTLLKDRSKAIIFARSLPEQKMRIVRLLQEQGEVVAMTGDGVNDAPALKKADIGVAMGITGTEVSKEAATMVLTDDSFASIVTAVAEGRRIYENLKKFIWFIFTCNIGELVTVFAAILLQIPAPLTAILILCIDLGTDILPAIALGVDNPEPDLMQRSPRDPKAKVLNKDFTLNFVFTGLVIGVCVTGVFIWTLILDGWTWGSGVSGDYHHANTVAFAALVFVQLLNAYSARSANRSVFQQNPFNNPTHVVAIITSVLMALLMIYVPMLNDVLGTAPLTLFDWYLVALATIIPFIIIEIKKAYKRAFILQK